MKYIKVFLDNISHPNTVEYMVAGDRHRLFWNAWDFLLWVGSKRMDFVEKEPISIGACLGLSTRRVLSKYSIRLDSSFKKILNVSIRLNLFHRCHIPRFSICARYAAFVADTKMKKYC